MNKKAQVYLIAALIIIAVFFGLMTQTNVFTEKETTVTFNDISRNYATESNKFLNSAIEAKNIDIPKAFSNFTFLFTSYSKSKNPGFGLIYAFQYKGRLFIGNYLDRPLTVVYGSELKNINGCYDNIPASINFEGLNLEITDIPIGLIEDCSITRTADAGKDLKIVIGGTPYTFAVDEDHPQLIIVSRMDKEEQRQVFLEGEFLTAVSEYDDSTKLACEQTANQPGCKGNNVDCQKVFKFSLTNCAKDTNCYVLDTECQNKQNDEI